MTDREHRRRGPSPAPHSLLEPGQVTGKRVSAEPAEPGQGAEPDTDQVLCCSRHPGLSYLWFQGTVFFEEAERNLPKLIIFLPLSNREGARRQDSRWPQRGRKGTGRRKEGRGRVGGRAEPGLLMNLPLSPQHTTDHPGPATGASRLPRGSCERKSSGDSSPPASSQTGMITVLPD